MNSWDWLRGFGWVQMTETNLEKLTEIPTEKWLVRLLAGLMEMSLVGMMEMGIALVYAYLMDGWFVCLLEIGTALPTAIGWVEQMVGMMEPKKDFQTARRKAKGLAGLMEIGTALPTEIGWVDLTERDLEQLTEIEMAFL